MIVTDGETRNSTIYILLKGYLFIQLSLETDYNEVGWGKVSVIIPIAHYQLKL